MTEINLELLLNEISSGSPCGENLEEDSLFLQLQDEARFVEERQMGDSILPAEEPDWKTVESLALQLLERTRDIQIAMHLTCALLRTDGISGLNKGLTLLKAWLENYWDSVYPLQDADDDYPILRVNTLSSLNDYTLVRGPINHIPLTQSALGSFSWRDIEIANNKIKPAQDENQPELSVIEAAFDDTNFDTLKDLAQSIKQALDHAQAITTVVVEKADTVNAPDLSGLTDLLQRISTYVSEKVQQRERLEITTNDIESNTATEQTDANVAVANHVKKSGIHSRNEVGLAIDEICKYFDQYEPSSPVPFLLLRAKKLLTMNYMEIMRDMTPDAVNQAEDICGLQKDNKE